MSARARHHPLSCITWNVSITFILISLTFILILSSRLLLGMPAGQGRIMALLFFSCYRYVLLFASVQDAYRKSVFPCTLGKHRFMWIFGKKFKGAENFWYHCFQHSGGFQRTNLKIAEIITPTLCYLLENEGTERELEIVCLLSNCRTS